MTTLGNKQFAIEYVVSVLKEDIPQLPQNIRQTIKQAIESRLMINPMLFGKPLRYSLSGLRSLRVGDYRVIYTINSTEFRVSIVSIAHRRDVYENL
ncbi:MAG: type II toxin-antitoxin system RelE/ParE family toxin [Alphaproteobacteria bacterium]|nr:type II toxin-antitoxin system RelE/ParE family toxin [Alphaproteobacteria bacterium]